MELDEKLDKIKEQLHEIRNNCYNMLLELKELKKQHHTQ
jgi:hypothetical protein